MTSGRLHVSSRSRNRLIVAAAVALAGGVAYLIRTRRPQQPEPAPAPPRIGYSRNGSAPTSLAEAGAEHDH
ncbi:MULTISPECIES: hypothetical protein [Nocardia]|jgi:hypothetical protein|uniref:Uncharacterized protein n=1 Tax=Nocardia abscessus TaxID=120957 RepID=A0ABS0BZX2_9NOCA|nr:MULTISPECIES: hypothetical protein [Nocardia]MBF6221134.1 hypothetical protein [Nocardia abscessus]MBF6223692.1 hypothetical protein [Nocardia abscessus]MBF6474032.1 hypothetical protein [Nocardia abscessus]MCC3327834.1 hypothetical protein [Nocardia abscessus]MDE1668693.1 hypothetical protein [Nocardia gipuzkoensis]